MKNIETTLSFLILIGYILFTGCTKETPALQSQMKQNRDTQISITGFIKNTKGSPIEGTLVLLKNNKGKHFTASVYTDSTGRYLFSNIPFGKYIISYEKAHVLFPEDYQHIDIKQPKTELENIIGFTGVTNSYIKGVVQYNDSEPLSNIPVTISNNHYAVTDLSDELGGFIFTSLPAGTYTLSCSSKMHTFTKSSYTIEISEKNHEGITFTSLHKHPVKTHSPQLIDSKNAVVKK